MCTELFQWVERALIEAVHSRQCFHSEADFQFSVAWGIKTLCSQVNVRLEYSFECLGSRRSAIDLLIRDRDCRLGIEFKYGKGTKDYRAKDGDLYHLKAGPDDVFWYDSCKDIQRLETLTHAREIDAGAVVIISNSPPLWQVGKETRACDPFRLSQGRILEGVLSWALENETSKTKAYSRPIKLRGKYQLKWHEVPRPNDLEYRYLMIPIQ